MAYLISGDSLTALADAVRAAAGTTTTYTPSAMAEQLNSLTPYKLWERSEDMPQYDKYYKRFGRDVLYITCPLTNSDDTGSFYAYTNDGGDYTIEIGIMTGGVYTVLQTLYFSSGEQFSATAGELAGYTVVFRITADGGIAAIRFATGSTTDTSPVYEVWGRIASPTAYTYIATNSNVVAWDVIYAGPMTSFQYMFYGAASLEYVNAKNWDTSSVTSMAYMFYNCTSLAALDVSGWDTSNVTNMNSMFRNCTSLAALDVSGWDTSSVTSMMYMFNYCTSLAALDVSGWDTSNVTNMNSMFQYCAFTEISIAGWTCSKCTSMVLMFRGCYNLTTVDMSGCDTSSVTSMMYMFNQCYAISSVDMSGCDVSSCTNFFGMFVNGANPSDFKAPSNIKVSVDFSAATALSVDSLNSIIAGLYDYSDTDDTYTLTIGSTNLAKLTDDEIAVATAKGWTVA